VEFLPRNHSTSKMRASPPLVRLLRSWPAVRPVVVAQHSSSLRDDRPVLTTTKRCLESSLSTPQKERTKVSRKMANRNLHFVFIEGEAATGKVLPPTSPLSAHCGVPLRVSPFLCLSASTNTQTSRARSVNFSRSKATLCSSRAL